MDRWERSFAAIAGVVLLLFGVWAVAAPRGFFDALADFEPYNRHLIQDIGAFQIGLGAVLLLAVLRSDALAVALIGVGIGMTAHLVSHLAGLDLGGNPGTDVPTFAILSGLLLWLGVRRWRTTSADGPTSQDL